MTEKKKKKNPGGRPSKFTPEMQKQIEYLARKGFTEQEIADALLIDQSTITKWKQKFPKFFTALKDWKAQADRSVERSLFQRATGYAVQETKAQFADGAWHTIELTKHFVPDTTAMIFWLKNRRPDIWRDKHELDADLNLTINRKGYKPDDD